MGAVVLAASDLEHIAAVAFVDIAIIVVVARVMGSLFKRIGQPAVVGEILAGIALGPSLLGALPGDLTERVFPPDVRPFLTVIAQLGLILFMFIVGLELDPRLVRGKERMAAVISLSSVALPFVTGVAAAALLFGAHDVVDGEEVRFTAFALFIGASMSVTAFPVLARILTERGMHRTQLGVLVLACAAVDDVMAWSLLAIVVAVAASSSAVDVPLVLVEAAAFIAVMFLVVRPMLVRLADRYRERGELTAEMVAVVLVGILVSSYLTSIIGIHAIFGAFVFGVVMPREGTVQLFHDLLGRFEQLVVLLLLPVFFIVTGLSVDVRGLGLGNLPELALVLAVACFGKFVGAAAAARALGLRTRRAAAIGILMNTRGLTELVILTIGLDLGVLDEQLFTMLVIMAITTTVITTPLLRVVYPDKLVARDVAESTGVPGEDVARCLVALSDAAAGRDLAQLAAGTLGDERPAELVISHLIPRRDRSAEATGAGVDLLAMTEAMGALRSLAGQIELPGGEVVVRTQFGDDPGSDLTEQLVGTGARFVVGAADDHVFAAVANDPPCIAVSVQGGATQRAEQAKVACAVHEARTDTAAVEVAMRLALARGCGVVLVPAPGRRAQRRAAVLATLAAASGLDCVVAEEPPDAALTVGPADTLHADLAVSAPRDHPTDSVEHFLEQRAETHPAPS